MFPVTSAFNAGALIVALAALLPAPGAHAQPANGNFPNKVVRFICPFPPGGANDLLARLFALKMADAFGQQVIVDNRGGAAGIIGAELGARAPADGYTITMANLSMLAINPFLYAKLPYDVARDFAPVIELAQSVNLLLVHPSVPATTVKELIDLAKAKPGGLNYATPGIGTPAHLATELLSSMAGIKLTHVPYKGSGAAIPAVIAGESQVFIEPVATSITHARAGRMRALAVTSAQRAAVAPELPTVAQSGLPGFEFTSWYGILAPTATPRAIVLRLNDTVNRILNQADIKENLNSQAMLIIGGTPEAFAAKIKSEMVRWGKVVKDTGARAE